MRVCSYICMTPTKWADKATLYERFKSFKKGQSFTHWPHHFKPAGKFLKQVKRKGLTEEEGLSEVLKLVRGNNKLGEEKIDEIKNSKKLGKGNI